MGKGTNPRPFGVSKEEYDNRFETIFGKRKRPGEQPADESQPKETQHDQDVPPDPTTCQQS
jgi:hypothetical protein